MIVYDVQIAESQNGNYLLPYHITYFSITSACVIHLVIEILKTYFCSVTNIKYLLLRTFVNVSFIASNVRQKIINYIKYLKLCFSSKHALPFIGTCLNFNFLPLIFKTSHYKKNPLCCMANKAIPTKQAINYLVTNCCSTSL